MSTITTLQNTDNGASSLSVINTNFGNLNSDKLEASDITGKLNLDQTSAQTILNDTPIFNTLTASELVATTAAKKLQSLAVATYPSLTELSYVKGLTSAVQGQINGKAATDQTMYIGTTAVAINRTTAALTLAGISLSLTTNTITGTKANFNTALSDGTFLFDGDAPTAHKTSHAVGGADSVFPADPGADRYLKWDDDPGELVWAEVAGGVTQLSDLSDVGVTTATDKNALMADGDSWESRALVEADISDLGSYVDGAGAITAVEGEATLVFSGSISLGGHAFNDIDITSEFTDTDDHIMSSKAIKAKIEDYGYSTEVGTVTAVTGTGAISSTGGTTPEISIATADTDTTGALTDTDWDTFNEKAEANQTFYIGTTQVAINRSSATQNLAGIGTFNTHTIPGGTGTLALTTDITGTNSGTNTGDEIVATGAELTTGTDNVKYVSAKAIKDSHNVPSVLPSTDGKVMTSNGTDWVSEAIPTLNQNTTGSAASLSATLAIASGGTGATTLAGASIPTYTSTNTLTNKRITQRVVTTTDDATAVIDVDITDVYDLSAIANATVFTLTGTPTDGQKLMIRFKDAGTTKGLTWTGFTAIGVTLPTDTTASKQHYVGCVYNGTTGTPRWEAIAVGEEA